MHGSTPIHRTWRQCTRYLMTGTGRTTSIAWPREDTAGSFPSLSGPASRMPRAERANRLSQAVQAPAWKTREGGRHEAIQHAGSPPRRGRCGYPGRPGAIPAGLFPGREHPEVKPTSRCGSATTYSGTHHGCRPVTQQCDLARHARRNGSDRSQPGRHRIKRISRGGHGENRI
jgi:hypothetical protein